MKFAKSAFLCALLFAQIVLGQVETEQVTLATITRTVEQTVIEFEGAELSAGSETIAESSNEAGAVLVTCDLSARTVLAFDSEFNPSNVTELADEGLEKRFLLTGSPGKYLIIVDTETGSFVRPVVIAGDPVPDDPVDPVLQFPDLETASEAEVRRIAPPPALAAAIAANCRTVAGKCERGEYQTVREYSTDLAAMNSATLGANREAWLQWGQIVQAEFNQLSFPTIQDRAPALRALAGSVERGAQ